MVGKEGTIGTMGGLQLDPNPSVTMLHRLSHFFTITLTSCRLPSCRHQAVIRHCTNGVTKAGLQYKMTTCVSNGTLCGIPACCLCWISILAASDVVATSMLDKVMVLLVVLVAG